MTPINSSSQEQLEARVRRFAKLPAELPWIEFKVNTVTDGPKIAEYVSALGNAARMHDEPAGFLVWGISDDREIVGTNFKWQQAKGKGNEDLQPWLERAIAPAAQLQFDEVEIDGKTVVILRIPAAQRAPYAYSGVRFFRKGTYNKQLLDFPDDERLLWKKLNQFEFEVSPVAQDLEESEITDLINLEAFFHNRPELARVSGKELIETMRKAGAISHTHEAGWVIPAWSALMYAHNLYEFETLKGFSPRVFHFRGTSRRELIRSWESELTEGYALSFSKVIELFNTIRPGGESIDSSGRRIAAPVLPTIAFREIYANALMHQDLEQRGNFLTVEVFDDRVEVTNPGAPLVNPNRFIDTTSTTRNSRLGEALRLAHFVEQRGSGWDKIVAALEAEHFPPAITRANGSTTVTLNAFKTFGMMSLDERLEAVYQHACLSYLENRPVNNASLRERFGISSSQAGQVSRLITAAVDAGLIVAFDPTVGSRALRYVPFWAG